MRNLRLRGYQHLLRLVSKPRQSGTSEVNSGEQGMLIGMRTYRCCRCGLTGTPTFDTASRLNNARVLYHCVYCRDATGI